MDLDNGINMNMNVISLHSAPRSGSTWLQMLFECHPNVTTKYQPLFSYSFKNCLNDESTEKDFEVFLKDIQSSSDDFLNMKSSYHVDTDNQFPHYNKSIIKTLVMKHTHNHYLMETFLRLRPSIKIVYLVRHPCGVINSFVSNPREFKEELKYTDEWLTGKIKNNDDINNFFGYNKWKELTLMVIELREKYPKNVYIVSYERLLDNFPDELNQLYKFCGLEMHVNVLKFFRESHTTNSVSKTAVYKDVSVKDKWKVELDQNIMQYILNDIKGTILENIL